MLLIDRVFSHIERPLSKTIFSIYELYHTLGSKR
jgi:hypothetical protein